VTITFRAAEGGNQTVGYSFDIAKPAGTVDGDIMIAIIVDDVASVLEWPAGWEQIDYITVSGGHKQSAAYKIASGEGSSYTFTSGNDADHDLSGVIATFYKDSGDWNFEDYNESSDSSANTLVTASVACIDDSILICGWGNDDNESVTSDPADMTICHTELGSSTATSVWYEARDAGAVTKSLTWGGSAEELVSQAFVLVVTGGGQDANVPVNAQSLSLNINSTTASATQDADVPVSKQDLALSPQSANISAGNAFNVNKQGLSLNTNTAQISAGSTQSVNKQDLSIAVNPVAISAGNTKQINQQSLTLNINTVNLSADNALDVNKQDLIFSINAASVSTVDIITVPVGKQDLTLAILAETILASRTWCWGHDTSVDEQATEDLSDGIYTGALSGSGDAEKVSLEDGEYWEAPTKFIGAGSFAIELNKYQGESATGFTVKYKTGATQAACNAAEWTEGTSFESTGWGKIRIEY